MSLGNNAIVAVYRSSESDAGKQSYPTEPTHSGVVGYLEQIQPELAPAFNDRNAWEVYKFFSEVFTDFQQGDKIVDDQGREFKCAGVQKFVNNPEINDHAEVTLNLRHGKSV